MTSASFSHVTIPSLIARHGRARSAGIAFVDGDEQWSWMEFDRLVNRVAHGLAERGVRGRRIGLLSPGSVWAYAVYFGVLRAGGVITPISPMWTSDMLGRVVADASVDLLFASPTHSTLVDAIRAASPNLDVVIDEGLDNLFADCAPTDPGIDVRFESPYSVIYSSGTTGTPKGIVHSHGARFAMATELTARFRATPTSRHVLVIPPFSNGSNLILLPAVLAGGTTILLRSFTIDAFLDVVERHRPTHVFMVPTQFHLVVQSERSDLVDWSCFEAFITAGAPMPPTLRQAVLERLGPNLFELWGLTEGVGTTISPEEARAHPGSVGTVWPGVDIRLIDDQGGEVLGGVGEIVGRTAMLMDGYLGDPEATAATQWRSPEGEIYLRTGDLGEFDQDGYLRIRGRRKDMIISGGLNVYPADIEAALLEHPAVADAAVFGVADPKWGETPVAYVVASMSGVDAENVRREVNARLATPQRLSAIVAYDDDLPRNALGKVLKEQLRAHFASAGRHERVQ